MEEIMNNIEYKEIKSIDKDKLFKLYDDNGWGAYTRDMDQLKRALENSFYVRSAWIGEELIGLIRIVSDGESIMYIQDILILNAYHRKGIGTELMKYVLDKFMYIRQKTLLTGQTEKQKNFYESLGFEATTDTDCVAFIRHDL